MSIQEMYEAAQNSDLRSGDKDWFPHWMTSYARFTSQASAERISINEDDVIRFLRSLLSEGKSAFTRHRVVLALIFYQRNVLHDARPDLTEICNALAKRTELERSSEHLNTPRSEHRTSGDRRRFPQTEGGMNDFTTNGPDGIDVPTMGGDDGRPFQQEGDFELSVDLFDVDEEILIGRIDPDEPQLFQEMRKLMRIRHYSKNTERAYVGWIYRFLNHAGVSLRSNTSAEQRPASGRKALSDLRNEHSAEHRSVNSSDEGRSASSTAPWALALSGVGEREV